MTGPQSRPSIVASRTFEFAAQARAAQSIAVLNQAFRELIAPWGLTTWASARISTESRSMRQPLGRSFGEPNAAWAARYKAQGYVYEDPVTNQLMNADQAFFWSDASEGRRASKKTAQMFDEAKEFGVEHGIAAPVRLWDGSVWGLTASGEDIASDRDILPAMDVASQYYIGRATRLSGPRAVGDVARFRLRPQEIKVLQLIRKGLNQGQIAAELDCSLKTVEAHLARARESYGVRTTAHLVVEAVLTGEIDDK